MDISDEEKQKFALAAKHYSNITELVREMTDTISRLGRPASLEKAMSQLDCMIQAVLLASMITDDMCFEIENRFIMDITDYADVTTMFNEKVEELGADIPALTWDNLYELLDDSDSEQCAMIVAIICSVVSGKTNEFITEYAPLEIVNGRGYLEELVANIKMIIAAFSEIDGDELDEDESGDAFKEASMGASILETILVKRWQARVEDFKKFIKNNRNSNGNNDNNDGGEDE